MKNLFRFLFVLILGVSSIATAAPITYLVNIGLSRGGVTGFIQTDGELGVLGSSSAFLDWNLNLWLWASPQYESQTFDLLGPLSGGNSHVVYGGGSVTASLSQLTFDFTNGPSSLGFRADEGLPLLCYTAGGACGSGHHGIETGWPQNGGSVIESWLPMYGVQVIAVAAPVPEPATLALVALGLGGFLFSRRKHTS